MLASRLGAMLRTGAAAALSQLMVLATMPIASRLFDEAAFGVLGLMVAMANILAIAAHLGYCDAVIAAGDDRQADAVVVGVLGLCALSILPVTALSMAAIRFDVLGYGALPPWTVVPVVIQVVAITLVFLLQQRAVRAQRYHLLATSHLVLGGARAGGQVAAGLALANALGLVAAETFSRVATALLMVLGTPATLLRPPFDLAAVRAALKRFRAFAAMRAAATVLNTVNLALPTLIVSQHFPLEKVGALSFTLAVLYAPLGFVQKSVGDVFTGTYLTLLRTDRAGARRLILQVFGLLLGVGAVAAAILWTAAVPLFQLVFGARWQLAGETAALFGPAILLMTVVVPLSSSLTILHKPGYILAFNAMRLGGLLLVMFLVPLLALDYLGAVRAIVAVLCLTYAVYGGLVAYANAVALRGDARPSG